MKIENGVKYLNNYEMEEIQNWLNKMYPDRDTTIIHEVESRYVHSDLIILYPRNDTDNVIVHSMGMSCTNMRKLPNYAEIFMEFQNDAIQRMGCESQGRDILSVREVINPRYRNAIKDIISITKIPECNNCYLGDTHTIEREGRYYALLTNKYMHLNNKMIAQYKLISLTEKQIDTLDGINDLYSRNKYVSSIVKGDKYYG